MKKNCLIIFTIFTFAIAFGQDSHVSVIHDFEGEAFDFQVRSIVALQDSLYFIVNNPKTKGSFVCMAEDGSGYREIIKFDSVNCFPSSIISNDSVIYGTTRGSKDGGGTIFKYTLKTNSFKIMTEFSYTNVTDILIKQIKDSTIWLIETGAEGGSIFTVKLDGSDFKKIYSFNDKAKGRYPTDLHILNDTAYIALYSGGESFPQGDGTFIEMGCFSKMNLDGSSYEPILMGGKATGMNPYSILVNNNKLFGMFSYSAGIQNVNGQFFSANLDGSKYDSLGGVKGRVISNMLSTDSLIYAISTTEVFGINPFNGEYRVFDDLESDTTFGFDVCSNMVASKGAIYFATQQGGSSNGGTILKWINKNPVINKSGFIDFHKRKEIDLNTLFNDPEGDSLTFGFEYDENNLKIETVNGKLKVTNLNEKESVLKIRTSDGWGGYASFSQKIGLGIASLDQFENEDVIFYPNPVTNALCFDNKNIDFMEVLSLNGDLLFSVKNPEDQLNISVLENGIYLLKFQIKGKSFIRKIIKE